MKAYPVVNNRMNILGPLKLSLERARGIGAPSIRHYGVDVMQHGMPQSDWSLTVGALI